MGRMFTTSFDFPSRSIDGPKSLTNAIDRDGTYVAPGNLVAGRFTFYLKDGVNVYPLHLGMNSVGRLPDNDVVVRDECVSRRHCAIVIHSDLRCELHDVASKNGTLLNGKKIPAPTRLQSGDQITLCNRRLTFHIAEAVPEPAAAG